MMHYTPDSSCYGRSRKRQAAVDMVRTLESLRDQIIEMDTLYGMSAAEEQDISNVLCEFKATLPKADQAELLHG